MSKWIHGYNLLLVAPLREGANGGCRFSVCEIRLVCDVEIAARYSKGMVNGIRTTMGTNSFGTLAE